MNGLLVFDDGPCDGGADTVDVSEVCDWISVGIVCGEHNFYAGVECSGKGVYGEEFEVEPFCCEGVLWQDVDQVYWGDAVAEWGVTLCAFAVVWLNAAGM